MAMRSMWKGSLGFGLVNIPVKMYTGIDESKTIHLNQLHTECNTRVKMPKYCPTCDKQLDAAEISKAYALNEKANQYLTITEADMARLPLTTLKAIKIDGFVKPESITDIRWFDTPYVLAPEEAAARAFVLFTKAMEELGVIGIAKIAIRDKESLCAVRPQSGTLLLQTMHWGYQLKDYGDLIPFASVTEKEMTMAKSLLSAMTREIDLNEYKDDYTLAFQELISAKIAGTVLEMPEAPKPVEASLEDQLAAALGALS